MRKSCLKSANDEDAHRSMHPMRTVGSVHATNKSIENELSHTWPRSVLPKFKVLSSGPFSGFVGYARYTNYPFSYQPDTFASSILSEFGLRYQRLQKTKIRLLP